MLVYPAIRRVLLFVFIAKVRPNLAFFMDGTRNQTFVRIFRFVIVGVLNTAVDFAVLNILVFLFGVGAHNQLYPVFKAVSFLVAVVNSYFFNKYWVFGGGARVSRVQEGTLFLVVSGIGFVLNICISTGVFIFVTSRFSLNPHVSANIGALVGSLLVLAWNFVGYKVFVFKN